MSIKDLVINEEEKNKLMKKQEEWVMGKCRYCGRDVQNNFKIKITGLRKNCFAHFYCGEREIKRIKKGLIENNPLYEIVKY